MIADVAGLAVDARLAHREAAADQRIGLDGRGDAAAQARE
jgi:hypothetical protein